MFYFFFTHLISKCKLLSDVDRYNPQHKTQRNLLESDKTLQSRKTITYIILLKIKYDCKYIHLFPYTHPRIRKALTSFIRLWQTPPINHQEKRTRHINQYKWQYHWTDSNCIKQINHSTIIPIKETYIIFIAITAHHLMNTSYIWTNIRRHLL